MLAPVGEPTDTQSRHIASAVREALALKRISRQALADRAKISISTLEKALSGRRPFTLATIVRLEDALGLRFREANGAAAEPKPSPGALAPEDLGSYSHAAVEWIEGRYLTLRPSFGEVGAVYAYRIDIVWDEASSRLVFREGERLDTAFTQAGVVAVPHQSGHIYLITNQHGQYRLAVLSRPIISGEMHGILTTLQAGRGALLTPVATPIVLVPLERAAPGGLAFGRVSSHDPCHAAYRRYLDRVTDDMFALFIPR